MRSGEFRNISKRSKKAEQMLGVKDLSGTNAERRIKEVLAMDQRATQTYSLKDSTKRNNANAHRYTEEQLSWISEKNRARIDSSEQLVSSSCHIGSSSGLMGRRITGLPSW